MTSQSDQFNRIASEDYDAEQIQEKIKAQKQAQSAGSVAASAGTPGRPYVAPNTPTEQWLADTIAEWLELDRISTQDDFFKLGGDSIKALLIFSKVREHFQVKLSPSVLFSVEFTVVEMAKLIDQYQPETTDDDELAALMAELDELSDDEAKAQLDDGEK